MKLVERNGLRILIPTYGYILRHKESGNMYSGKIYLGVNSSVDEYEELRDEAIDERLVFKLEEVDAKEESLNKIGKIVANQVTDDAVALTIKEFYDIWQPGVAYIINQYVIHKEVLYKVIQAHTSQDGWTPNVTGSLFAKVLIDPTEETILDWVQPDSTNPYMKGDKVNHNGQTYISTVDNNVWEPGVYGWEIVKEE